MKKMLRRTARVLVVLAIQVLAFQGIAEVTTAAKPAKQPKPEKGSAWYVMVLWEPGTPIPGSTEHVKKIKEPDLEKLKGKLLHSKDNTRFIELPVTAARELRKHEAVATLQRVWAGEPLEELSEDPYPARSRSGLETESDPELDWGPKDYTYDQSGNITGVGADSYSYDTAGRLIQATVGGKTETFKYDAFGNLVEKAIAGANPEVILVDGSSNRLIGESYDAAGNMMAPKARSSDHGTLYEYDSFSRLTKTRDGRNLLYDANDELVGVVSGGTHSQWMIRDFEGRLIREYTANTEANQVWFWQRDYVYADGALVGGETAAWSFEQPDSETVMGGKRHYHLDHLGNVRMVTDAEGRSISEHDYYGFGVTPTNAFQEELSPNPSIDSMRFAGHQRDFLGWTNIENRDYLDYMHARHYDPNLGRFLSVDPGTDVDPIKPQSWNKYSYVRNNSINATDPSGMYFKKDPPFSDSMNSFLGADFSKTFSWIDKEMAIRVAENMGKESAQHIANVANINTDPVEALGSILMIGTLVSPLPGDEAVAGAVYTVYRGVGSDGVNIVYVGMTKNLSARAAAHFRQKGIQIIPMRGLTGLSYRTARAVEQTLISHYGLPNLMNKIFSIGVRRLGLYKGELEAAGTLLRALGYL